MKSKREAKRILKAFGKEEGKARVEYVDSFLPEKTSFIGSISYRHSLRKAGIIVLLMVLIMALAVSAYAAIMHYLNYTKTEHPDNDEYVSIFDNPNQNGTYDDIAFYEPTYMPDGYELDSEKYDEDFQEREWHYIGENGDNLTIKQVPAGIEFHIDNERSTASIENIGDTEVVIYSFEDEIIVVFQYDKTLVIIDGYISLDEVKEIIKGILPK